MCMYCIYTHTHHRAGLSSLPGPSVWLNGALSPLPDAASATKDDYQQDFLYR